MKIELTLPTGNPSELRIGQPEDHAVEVLCFPRERLEESIEFIQKRGKGVYFLVGKADEDERLITGRDEVVYVGKGIVSTRLRLHNKDKKMNFWKDTVVVISPTKIGFGEDDIKFLEKRGIDGIEEAGRYLLKNKNAVSLQSARGGIEAIFEQAHPLISAFGFPFFTPCPSAAKNEQRPVFRCSGGEMQVKLAYEVSSGSVADAKVRNTPDGKKLLADGTLKEGKDSVLKFAKNKTFFSPSAAGAAILGRTCNGWNQWERVGDGESLSAVLASTGLVVLKEGVKAREKAQKQERKKAKGRKKSS